MARIGLRPTRADIAIADAVSDIRIKSEKPRRSHVGRGRACALRARRELVALLPLRSGPDRRYSHHIMLTTVAVTILPHLLKTVFRSGRPDRLTVRRDTCAACRSPENVSMPFRPVMRFTLVRWPPRERASAGPTQSRVVVPARACADEDCPARALGRCRDRLAIGAVDRRLLRFWTGYGSDPVCLARTVCVDPPGPSISRIRGRAAVC